MLTFAWRGADTAPVPFRPLALRLLPFLAGLLLIAPAAATASPAAAAVSTTEATATHLLSTELNAYATTQGPYANGYWNTTDDLCWACDQGGPATAAATLYVLGGRHSQRLLNLALDTINRAIATRQASNGDFSDPSSQGQSPAMADEFFGVEFGTVYRELAPDLSAATRRRWQQSLAAAADYLITNGNLTWYTNGNVNLGNAEFFYLVYLDTGMAKYEQAFEQAWSFLISPPQSRWPGYGLHITRAPHAADGADGAGYLAENGSGGTGFDSEYTELQAEIASRLYLISGEPRVLRLLNLLTNTVLSHTNETTWMLDTSEGTRHIQTDRWVNLLSPGPTVLGTLGGRADLAALAPAQVQAESTAYLTQPWQDDNPVFRRSLGNDVSTIALAAAPRALTAGVLDADATPAAARAASTHGARRVRCTRARCRGRRAN